MRNIICLALVVVLSACATSEDAIVLVEPEPILVEPVSPEACSGDGIGGTGCPDLID